MQVLAQLCLDGLLIPRLQHLFSCGVAGEVAGRRYVGIFDPVICREYRVRALLHGHADGSAFGQRAADVDLVLGEQVDVAGIVVADYRSAAEFEGAGGHIHAAAHTRLVANNAAATHVEYGILFGQPDAASFIADNRAAVHGKPAATGHIHGAACPVPVCASIFILAGGDEAALDGLGLGVAVDAVKALDGIALRGVAVLQRQRRAGAHRYDGSSVILLVNQPQAVQVQHVITMARQDNLVHSVVKLHIFAAQLQRAALCHPLAHSVVLVVEGRMLIDGLARQLGHLIGLFVVEDHGACPGVIAVDFIDDHIILRMFPIIDLIDVHVVADGQTHR